MTCFQEIHCSLLIVMEMEIDKNLSYITEKEKRVSIWKPTCHSRSSFRPFIKNWELLSSREKNASNAFPSTHKTVYTLKAPDVITQGVFALEDLPANLNHMVTLTIEINFK